MPIPKNHLRWLRARNFVRCAEIVRQGAVCEVVGEIPAGHGVYAICDDRTALYVGSSFRLPRRIARHAVLILANTGEFRYSVLCDVLDQGGRLIVWVRSDVVAETRDGLEVDATRKIEQLVIDALDPALNLTGAGAAAPRNPKWFATHEEAEAVGDGRLPPTWYPEKGWKPSRTTPSVLHAEALAKANGWMP